VNHEVERLAKSEELLQVLEECRQNGLAILSTGDKSWFFVSTLKLEYGQHLEIKFLKKQNNNE
jgi:hypothetical protein